MSIRSKLVALLVSVLTLGIGGAGGALILRDMRHDREQRTWSQVLLAEHGALAIRQRLLAVDAELACLSRRPETLVAAEEGAARRLLAGVRARAPFLLGVRLLDEEGRARLAEPAAPEAQPTLARGTLGRAGGRSETSYLIGAPGRLSVVAPLRRDERPAGFLEAVVDLRDETLLGDLRRSSGGGAELLLVDEGGDGTALPDGWREALDGLRRQARSHLHLREAGGEHLYASAPVGLGGLKLAMRWPWSVITADTRAQVGTTVLAIVLGVLAAGLLGFAFASYVTRPLRALEGMAARLAGSAPRATIDPSLRGRRDEIGALWAAFQRAEAEIAERDVRIRQDLETISGLNASLEERVRARTRDVEEAQARLLEVERFAAMGRTAAAIAHEMRNALGGLGMCVDLLLGDGAGAGGGGRIGEQIRRELGRMRDIADSLLTFARVPRLDRSLVDMHSLVARALVVLEEPIAEASVVVERRLAGGGAPLEATCDGHKIQGAIINLLKNAIEAMTSRPLDLDAAGPPDRARSPHRLVVSTAAAGQDVVVTVEDNGPGLGQARARLFEPFFSTKVTGTGLGLATARRVVEAHGGTLEASDSDQGGARFVLRLPRVPGDAQETLA